MLMTSFSWRTCHFVAYFLVISTISWSNAYSPADIYLLNCGGPGATSLDDREWATDSSHRLIPAPDIFDTSTASKTYELSPSVEETPYSTARIFRSQFTYTFPVSKAGQMFLRLYFYPTHYSDGFDMTTSSFSVNLVDRNILSANFGASGLQAPTLAVVKEYIVTVNQYQNRLLQVTFIPSPNSYAFVNGIEVVSVPDNLYIKGKYNTTDGIKMVGNKTTYSVEDFAAIETFYRLNVGGNSISSTNDNGMFRSWDIDKPYLLGASLGYTPSLETPINYTANTPPYTAPAIVYSSARTLATKAFGSNLTWSYPVDSGFSYLLRLHFCEFMVEITGPNQRVFSIYINNQTAELLADVFDWTGGRGIPVYKDYLVFVGDHPDGSKYKSDLWLAMHPNMKDHPMYENVILNGVEIFKLSHFVGSLASPNPEFGSVLPNETKKSRNTHGASKSALVGAIGGSVGGIILFSVIVGFLLYRRRRVRSQDINNKSRSTTAIISLLPPVRSRKFSLEEMKFATSNFSDNFVIGTGGFGNVYKGYLQKCTYPVAIKRLNSSSRQGAHEFQMEITILSNLRHRHLVPLIGCCDDSGEMILVYDYMVHGTLRGHLYRGNNPPLSWKQRLQICIGAARGLHYLHAGAERVIIHRDVKSTNILLDEKMVAKVSDFGLSKMGPSDSVTHMSTVVKGSFGYLDPEYYLRRQLTTKSDVYSFGVVLFEVLCARPVIMQDLPHEQMNLAEWSRICYRKGSLGEIVDPNLTGEIAVESLNMFGEVGYSCLRDHGTDRPTMSDVVSSLEIALQLQESHETLDHDYLLIPKCVAEARSGEASTSSTNSDGFKSGIGSVFSDIMNPNTR